MSDSTQVIRDENGNIIAVKGLKVGELEQYDVSLEYDPRKFNALWPNFPTPETPPMFWGNPNGARAARDALIQVLQAEHIAANSLRGALVGGGRWAFVIPIGATDSGQMTTTIGYYRHYGNWLWLYGRGIDTIAVDSYYKGVYARFETPPPALRIIEISETKRKLFSSEGVETVSDECAVIRNEGTTAVDISGWSLDAGGRGQQLVFPAGTVLAGGNSVTVWTHREDTDSEDAHFSFAQKPSVWNNKGDIGRLLDAEGELVDQVAYGNKA